MKLVPLTQALYDYVEAHRTRDADSLLDDLRRRTEELGEISEMLIAPEQGTLLSLLAGISGARRAIEIGTFTGYSAICIARGLPADGRLLCCDISAEYTNIAREFWTRGSLNDKIELRLGAAQSTLEALGDEQFDFAFIDADKSGYDAYYELLLPRLRPNSLIVFDNMLRRGRVLNPESEDDFALDALNSKLAADPRVQSTLLAIADGIHLCRKLG